MNSLEDLILAALVSNPDLPFREVIDILVQKYKGPSTLYSPVEIANATSDRDGAASALNVLTRVGALSPSWSYWNGEDTQYDLTAEHVQDALLTGVLIHPESGEEIREFLGAIALSYLPTELFGKLYAEEQKKKDQLVAQWRDTKTPLSQIHQFIYQGSNHHSPYDYSRAFIVDLIQVTIPQLEKLAKNNLHSTEDAITDKIYLAMRPGYPVLHREADSCGHVDLTLSLPAYPIEVLYGEAKIVDDKRHYEWYITGLGKLIKKYNRGRLQLGLFLCYCRKPNLSTHLDSYINNITTNNAFGCISSIHASAHSMESLDMTTARITRHTTEGRVIDIVHVWANFHVASDDIIETEAKDLAKVVRAKAKKDKAP